MDEVILRAIERLLAVVIGGLCVYLGYRLFLRIPEQKEGEGKIEFPGGASIFITRVGPGVFFAMFGAAIVGLSLYKGIVASHLGPDRPLVYSGLTQTAPAQAREAFERERLKLRLQVEFLNILPTLLKPDLSETERREVATSSEEYLTMLKYKRASDFPGGLYPPPLKALQIPQAAMSEESVKTLALSLRNEAYAFILLHELGHVLYRHPGYRAGIPLEQVRKNEADADRFALMVLERADTIPMGMALWFMAQVNYMPSKGQLMAEGKVPSDTDWRAYLETSATHPLTVERLSAIALYLDGWATRAGPDNRREALAYIATRLAQMAEDYDDADLQRCMAAMAYRADPATLAPRRLRARTGGDLMQEFCPKKP